MTPVLKLLRLYGRWWPAHRGKLKLVHLLAAPERLASRRFTVDFFGLRYSGDVANWVDWNVYFTGAYEPEYLRLLSDASAALRRSGRSVHYVDIGANVGHHVLFMSRLADQVSAFEPLTEAADELRFKVAENGLTNVRLFPIALGDTEATMAIRIAGSANLGTASLRPDRAICPESREMGFADVRIGDRFLDSNALPPIDLLKIDVEGYESAVFAGLRQRLIRDRPIILTELSGKDLSGFGSVDGFRSALYPDNALFAVEGRRGRYSLAPIHPAAQEVLCVPAELQSLLEH